MTTLLPSANANFLLQAGHDYLHQETMEWMSDLEFFKTELAFLSKILDKAFLRVKGVKRLNDLNVLEIKLKSFRVMKVKQLDELLKIHERNLSALDENKISKVDADLPDKHLEIKTEVKFFMDSIKALKKEIFEIVESQIKQKKKIAKEFEEGTMVL